MNALTKIAVAALSVGWVAAAQAAPITGSLAFADGANETGVSLLTRTSFTVTNATTQPGASGDFSTVAANLPVTIGTFDIPAGAAPTFIGTPSNFTAWFSGGTFTPSGTLAAFQPNEASVIANLNRSGNGQGFSVSSALTLAAPPAGNPAASVPGA